MASEVVQSFIEDDLEMQNRLFDLSS